MRKAVSFTLAGILCSPLAALAQNAANPEIAALRAEITALTARLDRLEQQQSLDGAAEPTPANAAPATANAARPAAVAQSTPAADAAVLKFSGDLRYRHETVNDDAFTERERQRIRARFGVTA